MKRVLFTLAVLFTMALNPVSMQAQTSSASSTNNENMERVQAFLKECGAFFIATVDGTQPRVRPFGVSEIINGRLYIMTGKVKDVYKQIDANGQFEICALKSNGAEWSMYKADDGNMAVLYIKDGTARFCSFMAPEEKVAF